MQIPPGTHRLFDTALSVAAMQHLRAVVAACWPVYYVSEQNCKLALSCKNLHVKSLLISRRQSVGCEARAAAARLAEAGVSNAGA